MKITNYQQLQNIKTLEELIRATDIDFGLFLSAINGGIGIVENCDTDLIDVNFLQANVEYPFSHGLGRVPNGYLNAGLNVSANVYNGLNTNNINQIFLKASAISKGKVLVF